jgi:hypothetical protein
MLVVEKEFLLWLQAFVNDFYFFGVGGDIFGQSKNLYHVDC